jgi:ABC-type Fe3+-hydroxamate transport system substrate-binding protein
MGMSDREKVINDLQMQIEELEERLAIVLEGQPEVNYALGMFDENYSITWPLTLIGTILLPTEAIGSAQTGNGNEDIG